MRTRLACGFTLLEVLVALLVLALGVLGAAAMQLAALRLRQESQRLSTATQIAAAMAERLRANPAQLDTIYLGFDYDAHIDAAPADAAPCAATACDSAQLAQADLAELKRLLALQLPTGRMRICRDRHMWQGGRLRWNCEGSAGAPVVIKVGWRGSRPDGRLDGAGYMPGVALAVAGAAP